MNPSSTFGFDAFNKKLGRAVIYGESTADLFELSEGCGWNFLKEVPRPEAHDWMHGNERLGQAAAPTVDEMLESIAVKLREDMKQIMLNCSESEFWLNDLYRRSKESGLSVTPRWR